MGNDLNMDTLSLSCAGGKQSKVWARSHRRQSWRVWRKISPLPVSFRTSVFPVKTWYNRVGVEYSILPSRNNSGAQASLPQIFCRGMLKWTMTRECQPSLGQSSMEHSNSRAGDENRLLKKLSNCLLNCKSAALSLNCNITTMQKARFGDGVK